MIACSAARITFYSKSIIVLMQALVKKCIQIAILVTPMYKRPTKQQMLRQRITMLVVMVFSILFLVTAVILSILGYRLDGDNGRLEQGALVQFDSLPSAARISVDGQPTSLQTPNKRSVIAGVHSFMFEKQNYRTWSKTLDLAAGTLTWLDYVRLVPNQLKPGVVREYDTVSAVKASPDVRTMLVQTDSSRPVFERVDIRDRDVRTNTLVLPAELYAQSTDETATHRFTMDSWDVGGRYILVRHDVAETSEWLVVDTESVGRSQNVSRLLGITVTDLKFSGTSGSVLFGLTDNILRKIDLSSATISRALVPNVTSFSLYDTNIITYVGRDVSSGLPVAGIYRDGDAEPVVLRTASTPETALAVATTRHYNDRYLAIAEDRSVSVLRGNYPTSKSAVANLEVVEEFETTGAISVFSFSPDGDYLLAQSGARFASYEVEYDRLNRAALSDDAAAVHTLRWLDEAYVWTVIDGMLSTREFDGNYAHELLPAVVGFDVTISQNGRYVYAVTQTPSGYALQRVTMILE